MLLGIKQAFQKKGVEGLLYFETFKRGIEKGYQHAECSWILQDNLLIRNAIEAAGGKRYKTYRIYGTPLTPWRPNLLGDLNGILFFQI